MCITIPWALICGNDIRQHTALQTLPKFSLTGSNGLMTRLKEVFIATAVKGSGMSLVETGAGTQNQWAILLCIIAMAFNTCLVNTGIETGTSLNNLFFPRISEGI